MAGTYSITIREERGLVATQADIDHLAVVIGCTSVGSDLPADERMSAFFNTPTDAQDTIGYGDASDTLCQIIAQRQQGGALARRYPAAIYSVPVDVAGSYGTIDITGVTGTAIPANGSSAPFGTYQPKVLIQDGGTIGTAGITYRASLDAGRTYGRLTALGTSDTITLANSGVSFLIGPPAAQVAALITFAVEARSDTLAHFADITVHDAADTSAAQVALAASSVPATAAAAWAVLNLCLAAMIEHEANISAHNGQDIVNTVGASAATDVQTGVTLAIAYKAAYNAHLAATYALSAAGLKTATATVAAPVILTPSDLLAPGLALMATNPRRLTFATAGVTPANAPASVAIVGTMNGDVVTETLNLAQTAASVTSVYAYSTITTLTYPAADGTSATIAIGYGQGVHNSADAANTITSTSPSHGTLVAGDTWTVDTLAPTPSVADVDAAYVAIADLGVPCAIVVNEFPASAAVAAHVATGLDTLLAVGTRAAALIRTRIPDWETDETELAWDTAICSNYSSFVDDRIGVVAEYGLITDAASGNVYLRSNLAQVAADFVRVARPVWADSPSDQAMANFTVSDSTGARVGHDEGPRGGATQNTLSNDSLGNRFISAQRLPVPTIRENVYMTVPWVMYPNDGRIRNFPTRRIANAMEREAVAAGVQILGSLTFYNPADPAVPSSTATLTQTSIDALHAIIFKAVSSPFRDDIQNWQDASLDTGLVQINPIVTVSGGNLLAVQARLAPKVFGYVLSLEIVLSVQE